MTQCETIVIQGFIDLPSGKQLMAINQRVPAFTRTWPNWGGAVADAITDYTFKSMENGMMPSLADFGLYLIAQAAKEPLEQERHFGEETDDA